MDWSIFLIIIALVALVILYVAAALRRTWRADQQEIMRINNELRQTLLDVRDMLHDSDVIIGDRIINAETRINLAVR